MQKFKVLVDIYTETDREADPEDEWDRDDTSATINVRGVAPVSGNSYFDVTLPTDFDPSRKLFLLWADYDTGDSFGRDRNRFEAIDIFHDYDSAALARETLLAYGENDYSGSYVRDDGAKIVVGLPWIGYFEDLNEIHVQEVPLCHEPF